MKPILSIIIPTYNCKEFLDEGLKSVLDQLSDECELIIVDDGSEDGTRDVLVEYENYKENLKVFLCEHMGASGARNKGIDAARGEYITFIDCDDCLRRDFLEKALPMTKLDADLYIFGIERIFMSGIREFWTVDDRCFEDVSSFADEYIRTRHLMIYSNCNKFYRRSIVEKLGIRFREDMDFGEDRLFNYMYLRGCGRIITSSLIMLSYIQRNVSSLSTKHVKNYFAWIKELHKAKMDCFLNLSKGTNEKERLDFIAYDLSKEIDITLGRFDEHPEEIEENLPAINDIIFGGPYDLNIPVDIIIVLGSYNCEYRIQQAYEIGKNNPGVRYLVSGGNICKDEKNSEAVFMAEYLKEQGVPSSDIYLETRASYTWQNLELSFAIVHELIMMGENIKRIGIATGGFHIPRTKFLAKQTEILDNEETIFFPAYGPNTTKESWFRNRLGKYVVLTELRKRIERQNWPEYYSL